MRATRKWILGVLAMAGIVIVLSADALAIIGRPATPVSYAGVARRTVRRGGYY